MSVRKVSTLFAVEGEREYRDKVAEINKSLKVMGSEIALVSAKFSENANSVEALTAKSEVLGRQLAAQKQKLETLKDGLANAQKSVESYKNKQPELAEALKESEAALKAVDKSSEDAADEIARLQAEYDKLRKALDENNAKLAAAEQGVDDYKIKINNASADVEKLGAEQEKTNKYLDEAKSSADGTAASIDKLGNEVKDAGGKAEKSIDTVANALLAAGLKRTYDEIAAAVRECIDASIDWESAWTGVKKTVEGTPEQLAAIKNGLVEMSGEIPLTKRELAGIAEAAGQLGIATDDVLSFTEVMAMLGSTTNLSFDAAATLVAKFANITGLLSSEYSNLGSTVVDLGNKTATTESDIMNMAMRIAAVGTQVGLTEPQILGFSAALSSVGLEAEAGGTAFSTAVKKIQIAVETGSEDLKLFADVAGMSADEFKQLWGSDVESAITAFIQGLGDASSKGESTIAMLEELGFSNVRISDTFARLAGNSNLVSSTLETAKTAWAENIALTTEAETRYGTTESKIVLMNNAIDNLKVAVGEDFTAAIVPAIDGITDMTNGLAEFIDESPEASAALAAITGGVAALTLALGGMAVAGAVKTAIVGLGAAAAGIALPVAGAVAAVAALAAGIAVMSANTADAYPEVAEYTDKVNGMVKASRKANAEFETNSKAAEDNRDAIDGLIGKVTELSEKENKSAADKALLQGAIDELNGKLPELGLTYDTITDKLNLSEQAMRGYAQTAYEAARETAIKAELGRLAGEQVAYEMDLAANKQQIEEAQSKLQSLYDLYGVASSGEYSGGDIVSSGIRSKLVSAENAVEELVADQSKLLSQYNASTEALKKYADAYGEVTDATEKSSGVTDSLSASLDGAGDSAEDTAKDLDGLKAELSSFEDTYTAVENGINTIGDAVKTALKAQAADIRDTQKETLDNALTAETAASKEKIAVWEDETAERKRLLEDVTAKVVAELDAQIAAIEGRTAQEKADKAAAARQSKIDGYNAAITEAGDSISEKNEWFADVMDGYIERSAGIVDDYADKIADAESDKARIIADSQSAIATITADYDARLSKLEAGTAEYAEVQAEANRKIADANADAITAELDANEEINRIKTEQANTEYALAEEKEAALHRIADASNNLTQEQREAAHKQATEMAEAEKALATEAAEYVYSQTLSMREEAVKAIEAQKKAVEDNAAEVAKQYDAALTAQKKAETERLESAKAYYTSAKQQADEAYAAATTEYQLTLDTYKTMQGKSQDEILALLEKYYPEWSLRGATMAELLRDGWTSPEKKFEDCVGDSVIAAVSKLDLIKDKIAEIKEEIANLEKTAATGDISVFEDTGANYSAGVAKGIEDGTESGIYAAKRLAQGVKGAVDEELGIHSPSKVGYYQGEMYIQGIINGVRDGTKSFDDALNQIIEMVLEASDAIKRAMEMDYSADEINAMQDALHSDVEAAKSELISLTRYGDELTAAQAEVDRLKAEARANDPYYKDGDYVYGLHEAEMRLQLAQAEYDNYKAGIDTQFEYAFDINKANGEVGRYIQNRNAGTPMEYNMLLGGAADEFRTFDDYINFANEFRNTKVPNSQRYNDVAYEIRPMFDLLMRDEKYRYRPFEEIVALLETFFGPIGTWGQSYEEIRSEYERLTKNNFYDRQKAVYQSDPMNVLPTSQYTPIAASDYDSEAAAQLAEADAQMNRTARAFTTRTEGGMNFGDGNSGSVVNIGGVTVVSPEMSPYQTQKAVERGVREALRL